MAVSAIILPLKWSLGVPQLPFKWLVFTENSTCYAGPNHGIDVVSFGGTLITTIRRCREVDTSI